jgi:lipopolysaccharide export system protein LptC
VSARSASPLPDRPDTASIADLRLRMDNPGGSQLEVTGVTGEIDGRARIARFSGLVRLQTSTGYTMETNGLTVTLDTGTVVSEGLLEIRAPLGRLTAGQVTFQADSENTGHRMLFTDGVRLIYTPQQ